jgi:two-component system, OmpR family, response regulator
VGLRLLLIEDDDAVADEVVKTMTAREHIVSRARDAQAGAMMTAGGAYDVIIMDRMLPGVDGLELVQNLRAADDPTPILVLTAMTSISDRVAGLRSGADDYLAKPFSVDELEARVEALARRANAHPVRIAIGDLVLDRLARSVHRGTSPAVVTRTMLLEEVWGFHFDPGTNLVESHISRLRGKIDRGGDPPIIHTVRGEGYVAMAR